MAQLKIVGKSERTKGLGNILFYPPTQKTPGTRPGMNAPGLRSRIGSFGGVGLDGPFVA
ncbi:MAG: hypothetical protein V3U06_07390 [Candidatus Binatia bacterium]